MKSSDATNAITKSLSLLILGITAYASHQTKVAAVMQGLSIGLIINSTLDIIKSILLTIELLKVRQVMIIKAQNIDDMVDTDTLQGGRYVVKEGMTGYKSSTKVQTTVERWYNRYIDEKDDADGTLTKYKVKIFYEHDF